MKKQFLAVTLSSLALSTVSQASTILAYWNDWADNSGTVLDADSVTPGFAASIGYDGSRVNAGFSSTDGTFGTLAGGSTTADGGLLVRNVDGSTLTMTITNTSSSAYSIDSLNFDFSVRLDAASPSNSYNAFDIQYTSGGLGVAGTSVGSASGIAINTNGNNSNYTDFDFTLSDNLTDTTLAVGESALFTFTFSGQAGTNGNNVSSVFDNVAITGTAIPEPSAALLSLGGLACASLRRRR